MKLATRHPGVPILVTGDHAVDVADALKVTGFLGQEPASVREILERWAELGGHLRASPTTDLPGFDLREVRLLPPVGPGQLIVCCGFNYGGHASEMGNATVGPTWFIKNANATVGSGEPITIPPDNTDVIDYEGELAVVIGRPCHRVTAAEALGYVAGYTLVNDVSARLLTVSGDSTDAVKRSVIDTHLGKQYPSFCPIGPVLLTADEVPDPSKLTFTTSVNGVRVQDARLDDMRLGVPKLIEWLSSVFAFQPGDIISTGSPEGSGVSQSPPRFLRDRDVVTVAATEIGELSNEVKVVLA